MEQLSFNLKLKSVLLPTVFSSNQFTPTAKESGANTALALYALNVNSWDSPVEFSQPGSNLHNLISV